jgi:DNA-binding MarR family transcriptional regulator
LPNSTVMPYNMVMNKTYANLEHGPCAPVALDERFRAAYWRSMKHLESLRLRQWEESNLTLPQLRVLFQLRRTPGITTGCLARNLGVTVSTTSGLVTKLAERGLVGRGTVEGDRRQIPLTLSESGQELAGELAAISRPFLDEVIDELGDGLADVVSALENLYAAAERVRRREDECS